MTSSHSPQMASCLNTPHASPNVVFSAGHFQYTITDIFQEQASRTPHAIALVYEGAEFTYQELNCRSNQLAYYLESLGVKTGDRVGICMQRSLQMIVGLLGILKAGAAYVPLDQSYPQERLRYMMQDAGAEILLTEEKLAPKFADPRLKLVVLDDRRDRIRQQPEDNPFRGITAGHPAYIIYTSGSTGTPKGVCICHRNAVRLVVHTNYADFSSNQIFLQFAPISFDAATFEIWGALLNGARLMIFPAHTPSIEELGEWIVHSGVTTLWLTAGLFHQIIEVDFGKYFRNVKQMLAGGDVLALAAVRKFLHDYPDCRLINGYGPTENGTFSTCGELREMSADSSSVIIGRPIANSTVHVLDEEMRCAAPGVVGELYLGGSGLAHGYWNQPALTAEKFIPNPFAGTPGERLYRSGDLGCSLPDGNLEFAGRMDDQVKLRGFRIELGEIEAVLARHPAVAQAVALAREDTPGDKTLVAYVVPRSGNAAETCELREYLGRKLPEYMVPAAFVFLEVFPLTLNGKVDRKALPAPKRDRAGLPQPYVLPATVIEKRICEIWAEVLHMDTVGTGDNFFDLGGDSLLAFRILSRMHSVLGAAISLRTFLEQPDVSHLARCLSAVQSEKSEDGTPSLGAMPYGEEIPVGCSQERVWFLQRLNPASIAYHFQATLNVYGPLNIEALERSLTALVHRHEILRTTFVEKDGRIIQIIHEPFAVSVPVIDLQPMERDRSHETAERLIKAEITRQFDVGRLPLIRWIVFSSGEHEHLLLHVEHHLIHDGWSFNVFLGELFELYRAFTAGLGATLPPLPLQFADFAVWQQRYRQSEAMQAQLSYWKQKLSGSLPVSEFPTDFLRPRMQTFSGGSFRIPVSRELSRRARALAHEEEVSLFVIMMAAFFALAYQYTRQDDFCVGTSMANRQRRETEGLLGMLVNNLVLRGQMATTMSLRDLVKQVRDLTLEAYENQDVPFQDVVQSLVLSRDLSTNPLFQTTFNFHNSPVRIPDLPECKLRLIEGVGNGGAKFDLGVIVIPATEQRLRLNPEWEKDTIVMLWEYNTDLFEESTVLRIIEHYQRLLSSMTEAPQQKLGEVCLLNEAERHLVLYEWNSTQAEFPQDPCVHELFEEQAARNPLALAIIEGKRKLTYAELNSAANRVAHYLRALGVLAGENVAVLIERSTDLVIAELAVLKCGAAYVPVDAAFPDERKAFMIADSGAKVALCTERTQLPQMSGVRRINVDTADFTGLPANAPGISLGPRAVAHVIYTSGSTGRPKGVMISHQGIKRLVLNNGYAVFRQEDRVAFAANPAFDATTIEIWAALLHGGALVVIPQETVLDPLRLRETIKRDGISFMFLTTGLFHQHADSLSEDLAGLRYLLVGGDALDPQITARMLRGNPPEYLENAYGPTEITTIATGHRITAVRENARRVPIGRPISNTQVYILNEAGEPAPIGVAGELYIGGTGVALGYLNCPDLTAEKFVPDLFAGKAGARMYRTGDMCRWNGNGTIDFLGRNDFQVKLRGFRIELGEIEARLAEHPGIANAIVVAWENPDRTKQLVAYYTVLQIGDRAAAPEAEALRVHLAARLPAYMLPAAYVRMETLPLNANGKINRKALPPPDADAYATHQYEAPQGDMETTMAEIFSGVLKLEKVGRHDNFFELGGHSLLATKLISRLRSVLGVELSIQTVFQLPTIAALAPVLEDLILEDIAQMPEAEAARIADSFSESQ
jgi:amino acid adenylation domain-containing protein